MYAVNHTHRLFVLALVDARLRFPPNDSTACLLRSHKLLLYAADVMFMLTTSHMALALYECLIGEIPARALQAAVTIAQFQVSRLS